MAITRPKPEETGREKVHSTADDHGSEVKPAREIKVDEGWLTCPESRDYYTGDNQPWRR